MSNCRTVIRNSGYLLGFKILSRAFSVGFLVFAASRLGPEMFGALSFVLVTVELLNGVGDLGVTRYGARQLVRNWGEREVWAGKILALQVLTSVPIAAAGLALLALYGPASPKPQLLLLGLLAFLLFSFINATESVFIASQHFFYSALFTFTGRLVYMIFGISALAVGGSVVMVMWGFLIAVALEAVVRLAVVVRKITSFSFRFPVKALRQMLVATVPFAIVGMAVIFSYRSNLMILEFMKGDAAAGIFNVAFTLFTPFVWISVIFSTTTFPVFTRIWSEDQIAARRNGWQWYRLMTLLGIPAALAVTLLARPILAFFPAGYADSASILTVLIWSLPFSLMTSVDMNILQAIDRQKAAANGPVLGAVVTTLFSLALIPFWGGLGAATAFLASAICQEIYLHLQVRSHFLRRWAFPLLLRPALGGLAMAASGLLLMRVNIWLAAGAGLAAYAMIIFMTGALRLSELKILAKG